MVMVLFVSTAVSVARVQGGPLPIGCQAAVSARKRIVENGTSVNESNGAHGSSGRGSVLGWCSRCSEVLIANASCVRVNLGLVVLGGVVRNTGDDDNSVGLVDEGLVVGR